MERKSKTRANNMINMYVNYCQFLTQGKTLKTRAIDDEPYESDFIDDSTLSDEEDEDWKSDGESEEYISCSSEEECECDEDD